MRLETIGVVGAGVIGVGVAQSLAQSGYRVRLIDVSREKLETARLQIRQNTKLHHMLASTMKATSSVETTLANIELSVDYGVLSDVDFVIENVPEKWAIKRDVYHILDEVCAAKTILAANTSAIPITKIASATRRPHAVIGMHFMNPVPMKRTVEVICGFHTSPETVTIAKELLAGMDKQGVVVKDSPGFVSNRVLMLTVNEAIFLVQDDVAPPEDIDRIFKECFGHKMGPLETADLIGLDTVLLSIEVLYESFNDAKYRPCPLLRKMVDAGLYGRKTGRGFYTYEENC